VLSADVLALARLHRERQQRLAALADAEMRRLWAQIPASGFRTYWDRVIGPAMLRMLIAAQLEAARGAQDYVSATLKLQGVDPDPAGTVQRDAFAGIASDGRALDTLLGYPMFQVQAFVAGGMPVAEALGVGLRHLGRIVVTQVQDAARVSTGVAIATDRRTRGYVRVVSPPSCSRCTILAGKWYAYNAGFQRHPHCDCTQAPAGEVESPQPPRAIYDAMTPEQRKAAGWSEADQQAIADGADIGQVTNARRDLRSMQVAGRTLQTTLQGASRRGLAGQRLGAPRGGRAVRLTPEALYAEMERLGWSRDELIRQLFRNGYII
jgi:hypothetical protein